MGKMTSTPYGLKVKEHTNHADYKDIFEDTVFKIYYNESTHVWTIKSNYDRLWSEGTQYFKGDTILEFTNTLTQEKTVLGQYDQEGTEVYRNIMYRIKCYQGEAGAGATKQLIQITGGYSPKTYDKETVCTDILHTHTSVYYNGKWHVGMYLLYDNPSIANCWMKKVGSLAITYAKPYWFLMTTQAGIEYGGQVYEARKLIRSWSPDEFVNMSLYYHKTRKRELPNPDTDKFDKLVYDVQCVAPNGQVTLTYEINAVPQDSVTFNPSDSPVRFHNIEFKASSDKWTIYSKCGYIKFDGKTYKTNKSIFSVGFDENLHVEIKDESNIYEIEETTTYTVKSVQVGSISYKLWTTTIDKTIKVEKTVDVIVEPWITVRYYEAMYEPVTIDDLILEFSNVDMKWYLKSNNDDLYCNGSNYKKGELIDYWDYEYIQNLKYITVLVTSAEDGIEIKKISSGDVPYLNNDIDEVYDDGLKICHSSTKGLWEIISVDDETYYNGIQFLEGQTIVSFKDKTILDQFTILVKKIIEGEEEYDNVMYTCYTGVDLINGITTLTVNGMSWADKSATDANKSVIVTKDTARSMYGYIWQKEESPGPPVPWPTGYIGDIIIIQDPSDNRWSSVCYVVPNELYHREIRVARYRDAWLRNYISGFDYFFDTENNFYIRFDANEVFWYYSLNSGFSIYGQQRRKQTSVYVHSTGGWINGISMVGKFIKKDSCLSIYSYGTHDDLDTWLFLIIKARYESSDWISTEYVLDVEFPDGDWRSCLQLDFDSSNSTAGYMSWAAYYNSYLKVNTLNEAVYFGCPSSSSNLDYPTYLVNFKYLTFKFYNENLSLIEIPQEILDTLNTSVAARSDPKYCMSRTIYFNNTFYVILYVGNEYNFSVPDYYWGRRPIEECPPEYFVTPHVFLMTYNDIGGFHLYNLDEDAFGKDDRVSPIFHWGYSDDTWGFEKYYGIPINLYTYQNELYLLDTRYDKIVDGEFGANPVSKRCIYKLDSENNTFTKIKEFKTDESTINIYDIVNKQNIEIDIYQMLQYYTHFPNDYEDFTHLEHVQNISRSLRRRDQVSGLYFMHRKYNSSYTGNRKQDIYYFTNPLFEEDNMNFCFNANTIGFRDDYYEDQNN